MGLVPLSHSRVCRPCEMRCWQPVGLCQKLQWTLRCEPQQSGRFIGVAWSPTPRILRYLHTTHSRFHDSINAVIFAGVCLGSLDQQLLPPGSKRLLSRGAFKGFEAALERMGSVLHLKPSKVLQAVKFPRCVLRGFT